MVNAMSNSTVPKFSIVIGNSYGAGNYAMWKSLDPRLIVGWPTAEIAMSGAAATENTAQIEISSLKSKGEEITKKKEEELFNKIKRNTTSRYLHIMLRVGYGLMRLLTLLKQKIISMGIEMANHNKDIEKYNVGVIQT